MTSPSNHKQVLKYPFDIKDGPQVHTMPRGAAFLHVAAQNDRVCLWALVDTREKTVERKFVLHGTGQPVGNLEGYCGTAHIGSYVWHLFLTQ